MNMKCTLALFLFFAGFVLYGQQDFDSIFANDPCLKRPPTSDLMEDNYWSTYLKGFRKNSLYHDLTYSEGYRLLYWGKYVAMVEIFVQNEMCFVVIDSMSWKDDVIHRSYDTIPNNKTILDIRNNCEKMWEYEQENNYYDMVEDDRDNWAFEFKIDDCYMSLQRYDVEEPLKNVITDVMRIGKLSGYTIHRIKGKSIPPE